jgi:FOG: TPR repeat
MIRASILLVVFGCFVIGATVAAAQDRNRITGFVFDDARRPVSDIYVELQNDFYSTVGRARTGASGIFNFAGLPPGQYVVRVLNVGTNFEEQSVSVSLVPISSVRGGGVAFEQVDVYLKTKKPRTPPTAAPGVVFAQAIPPQAKVLYEEGLADLGNKNEVTGLDKVKRSIEVFPDYYAALDTLGNEYVARSHYEAAYILLTKALTINPRSFSSTFGSGLAAFRLDQNDKAVDRFKQAVNIDNASVNAHLWLGIALQKKGDAAQSLKSLLQANKLSGETVAEIHWQLAKVYKDQKKFAEAAKALELFLSTDRMQRIAIR